jgi:hypothetical protein
MAQLEACGEEKDATCFELLQEIDRELGTQNHLATW